MSQTIDQVYRDYKTQGVPASGDHEPDKREIRALLKMIQNSGGQAVTRNTLSALNGVTPPSENYMGIVLTGPEAGYYSRSGGAWVFGRGFPDSVAVWTQTGGSGSAYQVAIGIGVDPSSVALAVFTPSVTNSAGATVNVSGVVRPILSATGAPIAAGELLAGRAAMLVNAADGWRVVSSQSRMTFRGAWASGTAYDRDDLVENGGSIWIAKRANTGVTPTEGDDWTLFLPGVAVADGSVTEPKHATGGVSTRALADASVTRAKLSADVAASLGVIPVATRTALAALDTTVHGMADLTEVWREGRFRLRLVADLSATETAARAVDGQQGVFVNSTDDANYVWQRIYSGALNVNWFGVPGDLSISKTDTYAFLDDCWYVALELGHDIYHPAGIYDCGENNFPYRQKTAPVALLDCKYITVFGDGPATILRTVSSAGADVLQLYGLKNITFRDFRITSDLTGLAGAGSNGISLVGGFDNIEILDLQIGPLRSVDKGTYVDGGKALTFQSEAATLGCGRVKARYKAEWCAQALGYESNLVNLQGKQVDVDVEFQARRCGVGFTFVAAASSGAVPAGFHSGVRVKATVIDCQRNLVLNRAHGVEVDMIVGSTVGAASTKATDYWGNFYRASDIIVEGINAVYAKNSRIKMVGSIGPCAYLAQIGATTSGSSGINGISSDLDLFFDVRGTPSVSKLNDPLGDPDYATLSLIRSRLTMAAYTFSEMDIPASWKSGVAAGDNANIMYLGTTQVT